MGWGVKDRSRDESSSMARRPLRAAWVEPAGPVGGLAAAPCAEGCSWTANELGPTSRPPPAAPPEEPPEAAADIAASAPPPAPLAASAGVAASISVAASVSVAASAPRPAPLVASAAAPSATAAAAALVAAGMAGSVSWRSTRQARAVVLVNTVSAEEVCQGPKSADE